MNGVRDGGLLEHLQAEHHRINLALAAIRQQSTARLLRSLEEFKHELEAHFAQEETDGCLAEAAARCPSTAVELRSLKAEHQELLRSLDQFIRRAANSRLSSDAAARELDSLSGQLHAHEAAESRFLQYALGGDAAEYDVEGND